MPTGLVQRPRSRYIYLFLVMYGPGAAKEKQEIYIPPPCLEISYVLTMIAYENRSYENRHMPGTLKPHTCNFFSVHPHSSPLLSSSCRKKPRHEQDTGMCTIKATS